MNNRPECEYDAGDCCLDKIICRNPRSSYCLCSDPDHPNCEGQWKGPPTPNKNHCKVKATGR